MKLHKLFPLFLILTLTGLTACGKKQGFAALDLPRDQAGIQDLQGHDPDDIDDNDWPSEPDDLPPSQQAPKNSHDMVSIGRWVIANESRKLGTACNTYVQRVLELMGFESKDWLANEFDQYIQNSDITANKRSFAASADGTSQKSLEKFLQAYPEKTGFIFQWKRKSGHGHVGIVHRVGDQLIIYHANLHQFAPKAQRVTPGVLLYPIHSKEPYTLNVFWDLRKSSSSN